MGRTLAWIGTWFGLAAGLRLMFIAFYSQGPFAWKLFLFSLGALLFAHLLRGVIREWRAWRAARSEDRSANRGAPEAADGEVARP
ncbi:hypothetical protein AB0M44_39865 [Streptosporangium subroseum]|uniref:hypothetical protein n=1 Tax=Streptosporangium subroseum TaxID=106412 RepID=UPI0034230A49